LHFFHEKRKKQFIPLPWKIGEFVLRNINKIDEFANHFNNVSLKYAEKIKGFDPNKIFVGHMLSVGFNNSFIQTVLSEEEEVNSQSTHVHNAGDLETLLSSNDLYKQKGKIPVKEVLNLQLSLLRMLPPGAVLQPTQLKILSTIVPVEGETRILPLEKLKVHTSFP
jgi:hypothetical protein